MKSILHRPLLFAIVGITLLAGAATAQVVDFNAGGASQIWQGPEAGARVAAWLDEGDVSGDVNRRDLAIGAPGGAGGRGQLFIIINGNSVPGVHNLASSLTVIITGENPGDSFGTASAAGHIKVSEAQSPLPPRDLAVAAPDAAGGRGIVYLFSGGFTVGQRLGASGATFQVIGAPGDRLGAALAAGDFNGDGYRELVLGAPGTGRVYIINGGPSLSGTRDLGATSADATITGSGIGSEIVTGELNADGRYELALGAPTANGNAGAVYVFFSRSFSGALAATAADATLTGIDAGDRAGTRLRIKTFDGDANTDLLIGAPGADGPGNGRADAGEVYFVRGQSGFSSRSLAAADATFFGPAAGGALGADLVMGDVNRRPPDDLLMLAPGLNSGAGQMYLWYGRSPMPTTVDLAVSYDRIIVADRAAGSVEAIYIWENTGEGAEDIIAGVPSNNNSTGAFYTTFSPRLVFSPKSISFAASQTGAATDTIQVSNNGYGDISYKATSNRSWLEINPAAGSASRTQSGLIILTASGDGREPGTYSGTVTVESTSADLALRVTFPVTLTVFNTTTGGTGGTTAGGVPAPTPTTTTTSAAPCVSPPATDGDCDGLPTAWERQFGLSSTSAVGDNGSSGDPDGDGLTNAQEFSGGTHPRGFFTRYLPEGATGEFFDVVFALLNSNDVGSARTLLRFLKSDGTASSVFVSIPPRTRRTVLADAITGLESAEFSTVVESDAAIVADRTMTWDGNGYGSHAETSLPLPSDTWYLAEGATHSGFDLFYLLQNPRGSTASVDVTFLRPAPNPPVVKTYLVRANSRFTVWVNLVPEVANSDVSAVIRSTNGVPIIVERAMYLNAGNRAFGAGHDSAGVTSPATSWFLAEGATGRFFDLFILIANPTTSHAVVEARYLLPSGEAISKTYLVGANSRFNIWVDHEHPALADTAVSTTITSLNQVPLIVERSMWWPGGVDTWQEAHNSPGAPATGTRWALAEGEVGGARGTETYVLVANTSEREGAVKVTLMFEDSTTQERTFAVRPFSRFNVAVHADFPGASNRRFGVLVESVGAAPAQIVVERAMYSNAEGVAWAAGTNAIGTKIQ
jgi:hypothetical protein